MTSVAYFISTDSDSAGRIEVISLSDQSLMELMLCGAEDVRRLKDSDGNFREISDLEEVMLNESGDVIELHFDDTAEAERYSGDSFYWQQNDCTMDGLGVGGTIDLRWIPRKTVCFKALDMEFEGVIETNTFPESLRIFSVSGNKLTGTFSIEGLPRKIVEVVISQNKLQGTLNLSALPRTIQDFKASYNEFSGTLDFGELPPNIKAIDISTNQFSGSMKLANLPHSLRDLYLYRNNFAPDQQTLMLPQNLQHLSVDTIFKGKIVDSEGNNLVNKCLTYYDEDVDVNDLPLMSLSL